MLKFVWDIKLLNSNKEKNKIYPENNKSDFGKSRFLLWGGKIRGYIGDLEVGL